MTFRVDDIKQTPWGWYFCFKGVDGKGIYGRLITNQDGAGLNLVDMTELTLRTPGRCLCSANEFFIPLTASKEQALNLVSEALLNLGWGPSVDKAGKIISEKKSGTK